MPQPHPRLNALSPHASPHAASSSTFRPIPYATTPRPPPYMVALSGWPDPVYIESPAGDWDKRRSSRPNTPRGSISGEVRDGISPLGSMGSSPVPGPPPTSAAAVATAASSSTGAMRTSGSQRNGTSTPIGLPINYARGERELDTSYRSSPRNTPPNESIWTYQTSSTRSTTPPIRHSTFNDPRLAPNVAVMQNRGALKVAPAWHTSHIEAGQKEAVAGRGVGWLVMRATPDVYPPPNGSVGMARIASASSAHSHSPMPGSALATEVYPRDPENTLFWGEAARTPASSEDRMEVDK